VGFRPPKGIRPPQLEGKRTGRPKGSRNYARVWDDAVWGYEHRYEDRAYPPTLSARLWWTFAAHYPDEVEDFLTRFGRI
jgi:hypothetical protein